MRGVVAHVVPVRAARHTERGLPVRAGHRFAPGTDSDVARGEMNVQKFVEGCKQARKVILKKALLQTKDHSVCR
jgi:hypothetical protein